MKPPNKRLSELLAEALNPGNSLANLLARAQVRSPRNALADLLVQSTGRSRVNALDNIFTPSLARSPSNALADLASLLTVEQPREPVQSLATLLTGALNPLNALGERRREMVYQGTKRRVFISHFRGDKTEVDAFINYFANQQQVFTPYVLGANDNDEFIKSTNPEYVMSQIRQKYLQDSTVTLVLLGSCTHSRRYVDWEIKSSLRQGKDITPNGLIGILLPSKTSAYLPPRFEANWVKGEASCYARYRAYPTSPEQLGGWIDDAYNARTARANLIANSQDMMKYNAQCKVCGVTH